LLEKCNSSLENHIALKNFLSNDATHMKASLIPNLLLALESNYRDFKNLKLFEVEKVFRLEKEKIIENYNLA
jgi:phenylalanyl-tRNA synthetase beta subunit